MNKTQFAELKARIAAEAEKLSAEQAQVNGTTGGTPTRGDKPSWLDNKLGSVYESASYNMPTLTGIELVFATKRAKRLGMTVEDYLVMQAMKNEE